MARDRRGAPTVGSQAQQEDAPAESGRVDRHDGTPRGEAGAGRRRGESAVDRVGRGAGARGAGREARLHVPGRAASSRACASSPRASAASSASSATSADEASLDRAFAEVAEGLGGLDLLVHSIAFAQAHDLEGRFTDTKREDYLLALNVSSYSLVAMTRRAEPLMRARGGGAVVTMTYLGGERAVPHYNVMGVAKAALDVVACATSPPTSARATSASTRSAPARCARSRPARSRASPTMESIVAERAPLKRNIDASDVGSAALYLLSPHGALGHRHDPVRRRRLPRDGDVSSTRQRARVARGSPRVDRLME